MKFGVPKEMLRHENRVGLTPFGVSRLIELGHEVYVQQGAGERCLFSDEDYTEAGAEVVFQADEVYGRSDVVCRIAHPTPAEIDMLRPGTVVCGVFNLALAARELFSEFQEGEITLIGLEAIENRQGLRPVLTSLGEIAAQMAVHNAANLLKFESGGRGLVLGGVAGIPPATVVILGAGVVGQTAATLFLACGAHVIVLDSDLQKLRDIKDRTSSRAITALASERHLRRFTRIADVVVGAILLPGGRTPFLVTSEMVKQMKPGSVILDIAIDQGGCVETSRPTTLADPTFVVDSVIHYCVPNMTSNAPRIASRAVTMGALPFLELIGSKGIEQAVRELPGLAKGTYVYRGQIVHERAAEATGLPIRSLADLLPKTPES